MVAGRARAVARLPRSAHAMDAEGPERTQGERFGTLLKRYRVTAGLSQEALAERARLSVRAISA